jgi:hypothetical protein
LYRLLGQRDYGRRPGGRERAREADPNVRLFLGLLEQAKALLDWRLGQLERRHGKNPFPEIESRIAAISGPDPEMMSPEEKLAHARETLKKPAHLIGVSWPLCAEMEKIVLGGVSAYTSRMLARSERRAQETAAWLDEVTGEDAERFGQMIGDSPST